MLNDQDTTPRTPWGWIRRFAWFLIAWPLLSLLAIEHWPNDWETILIGSLGPAAVGLILLAVDALLTWSMERALADRGLPVPNLIRDLSNIGWCMAILVGVNALLVLQFEDPGPFADLDSQAGPIAGRVLLVSLGAAFALRLLARLVYGPSRHVDHGPGWGASPQGLRLFGYLTLIPCLLLCTVMIDYTMRGTYGFEEAGWIGLPLVLGLGLRSAMARAPRFWARSPWEAELRRVSLYLPWYLVALAFAVFFGVIMILLPLGFIGDEAPESLLGKIGMFALIGTMGLFILFLTFTVLRAQLPDYVRCLRVTWRLHREPDALAHWEFHTERVGQGKTQQTRETLRVHLKDGAVATFTADEDAGLAVWLKAKVG